MISIENAEVYGWEAAIRGMRNPLNSWGRSDSEWDYEHEVTDVLRDSVTCYRADYAVGTNDHDLMMRLAKAGTEHSKYRRMITITMDLTAPLYFWKEWDTYKHVVSNSCSTMHKIHAKEFTLADFSHEHLDNISRLFLNDTIVHLNEQRERYLDTKDKDYWWQMIQLLPSSYNQRRTVHLNYEVLAAMYRQRKNHKLDEWREFCSWIEELAYSEIITLKEEKDEDHQA